MVQGKSLLGCFSSQNTCSTHPSVDSIYTSRFYDGHLESLRMEKCSFASNSPMALNMLLTVVSDYQLAQCWKTPAYRSSGGWYEAHMLQSHLRFLYIAKKRNDSTAQPGTSMYRIMEQSTSRRAFHGTACFNSFNVVPGAKCSCMSPETGVFTLSERKGSMTRGVVPRLVPTRRVATRSITL